MSANALPYPASPRARSTAAVLGLQALAATLVLACAALGLFITQAYPIRPAIATALFGTWFVFAAFRPSWSLVGMLALLPVLALAPLTGWLLVEEFDLLVLATAGGGYAAWIIRSLSGAFRAVPVQAERPRVSLVSSILLALFFASTVVALERGLSATGGYRLDWFQNYDEALNALRVFKSFVWVLLVLPLVVWEARRPHGLDRIVLGLTAALALGALAVVHERFAFVGLLDFSDDYRVTGSFWEMHIGGAALDAFLAITLPFAVREVLRGRTRERFALAFVVLGLAAYACLVTFSRGVYLAVPISLLVLVALLYRQRPRVQRVALWPMLARGIALVVAVEIASVVVFRAGGYRASMAVFVLFAATLLVESTSRRSPAKTWVAGALLGLIVGVVAAAMASVVWKGPYLAFACASAAFAFSLWRVDRGAAHPWSLFALASTLWLALAACHVAWHWGGPAALRDCAIVTSAIVALALASRLTKKPLWPEDRRTQLATIGAAAVVTGCVVVFLAGAYMGGRVAASSDDFDKRIAHWREGVGRLHGADQWLLGKGLGRYPATSLYEAPEAQYPGTFHLVRRGGETFLRLTGARAKYLGWGEMFRVSQRVDVQPNQAYRVRLEMRAAAATYVHIELCEKHLLYNAQCSAAEFTLEPTDDRWVTRDLELNSNGFAAGNPLMKRSAFFAIALGSPTALELRRVRMIGPGGVETIANGDFADRTARWFSSSDKWHLPFHIKSLALDVLFDQGLVGLALFTLLVGGALLRVSFGRARQHPDAPYLAAGLVGFVMVGAFDSLLDMPRVAFLFYFVTVLALVVRNPSLRAPVGARPATPSPVVDATSNAADDAAARAERRRTAFGERRAR